MDAAVGGTSTVAPTAAAAACMAALSADTETPLLAVLLATVLSLSAALSTLTVALIEAPTAVTASVSTGTLICVAIDVLNPSASNVETSPLRIALNWTASTSEPPGGTAGDGGGDEGGGGDGGGEFWIQSCWSG